MLESRTSALKRSPQSRSARDEISLDFAPAAVTRQWWLRDPSRYRHSARNSLVSRSCRCDWLRHDAECRPEANGPLALLGARIRQAKVLANLFPAAVLRFVLAIVTFAEGGPGFLAAQAQAQV